MSDQWIRKCNLIVSDSAGTMLDLSEFRITFNIRSSDTQTPNTLRARIYNLSRDTAVRIGAEFQGITLQAGYETGNFGIIFTGTIIQYYIGRENNINSYLELFAQDGDIFYNNSVISKSIKAGATSSDLLKAIFAKDAFSDGIPLADDALGMVGNLPANNTIRGRVLFGMSRDYAEDWSRKHAFNWSIQNGKATLVPVTGYRPGEAVQLSAATGLVGIPEGTNDGIHIRALINPKIQIGCLVQVQPEDTNTLTTKQWGFPLTPVAPSVGVSSTGFYRVLTTEHTGDTRGQPWYVDLTCLAVDATAAPGLSVKSAG